MYPKSLDDSELVALIKLAILIKSKEDVLKVKSEEIENLLGFGRDKNDSTLTKLVKRGWISREQDRDETGKFNVNNIKILTNLISW